METELRMLEVVPQVNINPNWLKAVLKKVHNWKTPDFDSIHGFWFEILTSIHDRLATEMNKCIHQTEILELMTKTKTILIQKDPLKGTAPTNYRPMTCLPMIWKILIAQIREQIYYLLTSRGIFPNEQKGCRKRTRDTDGLLYIQINKSSIKVITVGKI